MINFKGIKNDSQMGISKEEYAKQTTLQCDVILEQLKSINGHASKNLLKK